jgi:D-alanyl-lipoteichoic acid acyltransferase DltB (MBOAT superfamily)
VALFLVVYAGRLLIGRRKTETPYVALLLLASCAFYAWHVPAYLLVMLTSTVIDYFAALWMVRLPERSARRRLLLAASLVANLGMLGFFKYAGFATESIGRVLGLLGLGLPVGTLDVVLPIGISFYTFQSMSYTIDVYRGQLRPTRDFTRFLLYVCFFPQLVAGPIVRARDFLYQFARRRQLSLQTFNAGLYLIVRGYFLKVVCANNIAVCVDRYWDAGWQGALNSPALLLLAILFSFQIFCDFEGYSSIARGLANLLGFRLPLNFNNPYLATSFKNFWQRWHITLSQWLRDYLYLPLGGNRGGRWRTLTNLMIVMLLAGLWHGAAFHFVAWGGIHGAALVVERLLGLERAGAGRPARLAHRLGRRCSIWRSGGVDLLPQPVGVGRHGLHPGHPGLRPGRAADRDSVGRSVPAAAGAHAPARPGHRARLAAEEWTGRAGRGGRRDGCCPDYMLRT